MSDRELLTYLERLQQILVDVGTGQVRIQETEKEYIDLYFKIATELDSRNMENPNPHISLWDYYSYWRAELPTYQSRRDYVRESYKEVMDRLRLAVSKKGHGKQRKNSFTLSLDDLHEEVLLKCKDSFIAERYGDAILSALKLVEVKVREKGGFDQTDIGTRLMEKAFAPGQTPFIISDDAGEVGGWKDLFKGTIGALKNPESHAFKDYSRIEAFQILCIASFLLSFVDELELVKKPNSASSDEINLDDIPF